MKVVNITRKFTYNGLDLADPSATMTADQVRAFFAQQFPELNNALVEGPVTKGNVSTYSFVRAAGAKGRGKTGSQDANPNRDMVMQTGLGVSMPKKIAMMPSQDEFNGLAGLGNVLMDLVKIRRSGTAMHLPSSAYGIWG